MGPRLSLVTIDQAISSLSNILFLVLAAHVLPLAEFGLFNIIFLTYVLVQSVGRALVSDPLLIHPDDAIARPQAAVGSSLLAGSGLGVLVAVVGVIVWFAGLPGTGAGFVALALFLPLLLVQDLGRFIGFAAHRPGLSVLLDSVWLVGAIGGATALYVLHNHSLGAFVVAWAGSGALAGLIVFWAIRHTPRPSSGWLREQWPYASKYLVGYIANQGSALFVTVVGGWIVGAAGLGALRGASLLSRPYGTFQIAAAQSTVIRVARGGDDEASVRASLRRTGILVLSVAAVMSAILLVLPDSLGRVVLGENWSAAEPLLLPICAGMFAVALQTPTRAGLIGLRQVSTATAVDVIGAVSAAVFSLLAAYWWGVQAALWAVAVVGFAVDLLYLTALLARLSQHRSTTASGRHRK